MAVKKQVRNQYTGAAGITQREADTLKRCIKKIEKIANKKNLWASDRRRLLESSQKIMYLLIERQRWYDQ